MLEALGEDATAPTVCAPHLLRALDDPLDSTQQLTRSVLGVADQRLS